jgi:transketolase
MRQKFIEELCKAARADDRIVLLTADLGFGALEQFVSEFPDRYFNVGVAEQSLIATATGLAEAGFVPFCYSIATFASLRGLEFIRNGPVAHSLPVRIIGIGPGMDYGFDGLSHFAVDDIGSLRCQPGLSIWTPSDEEDVSTQLKSVIDFAGPVYMRILKNSVKCNTHRLTLDSGSGAMVSILSLGDAHLIGEDIRRRVAEFMSDVSHQTVNFLGLSLKHLVQKHLAKAKICIVVENHYVVGGLSSIIAEVVANSSLNVLVIPVGVESLPIGKLGSPKYLSQRFFTDKSSVISRVMSELNLKFGESFK